MCGLPVNAVAHPAIAIEHPPTITIAISFLIELTIASSFQGSVQVVVAPS